LRVFLWKQNPIIIDLWLERSAEFLIQTSTSTDRYDKSLEQLESENVMCILAQTKILTRQNLTQANPQMIYSKHLPVFVFTRQKIASKPEESLKIKRHSITDNAVEIR
jgi:hypothetical protein